MFTEMFFKDSTVYVQFNYIDSAANIENFLNDMDYIVVQLISSKSQ